MMAFFDVLLIDNDPILTKPHLERMKRLESLIEQLPGKAELATRNQISFSSPEAKTRLTRLFADGITRRWEGFVLKPSAEPYISLQETTSRPSFWIKLKKDYIAGLGDTADFAIVGAGFDSNCARSTCVKGLRWTHFHIGCLENKDEVKRFKVRPCFRIIDVLNHSIIPSDLETLNRLGQFKAIPFDAHKAYDGIDIVMEPHLPCTMTVLFSEPLVFEVMGAGFDKPENKRYYTLRFPRVIKIHWDRSCEDTVSFAELQRMADRANRIPIDGPPREEKRWMDGLECADMGARGARAALRDSSYQEAHSLSLIDPAGTRAMQPRRAGTHSIAGFIRVDTGEREECGPSQTELTGCSERGLEAPAAMAIGRAEISSAPLAPRNQAPADEQRPSPAHSSKHQLGEPGNANSGNRMWSRQGGKKRHCRSLSPTRLNSRSSGSCPMKSVSSSRDSVQQQRAKTNASSRPSPSRDPTSESTRRTTSSPLHGFHSTVALLSPCVAQMPYLTENLLPSHGIFYTLNPETFIRAEGNLEKQKIVLVESKRSIPTAAMLQTLRSIGIGKMDIQFYDWRLLECLIRQNQGKEIRFDPWYRFWIATV